MKSSLHPNINMHISHTVLHTIPIVLEPRVEKCSTPPIGEGEEEFKGCELDKNQVRCKWYVTKTLTRIKQIVVPFSL